MTGNQLEALAQRCEEATENETVQLLWEAWDAIHGKTEPVAIDRWPGWRMPFQWDRFKAKVNAEAYESAALTLVPEGCGLLLNEPGSYVGKPWAHVNLPHDGPIPKPLKSEAVTLALAITAAALRARAV